MIEILVLWIGLAIAVAIAAGTRGRSGAGWFFLAVLISPLIAGLIVLALPSLALSQAAIAAQPFAPEGVLEGIPYRITSGNMIEAMLPGGRTLFQNLDQLSAAAKGGTVEYQQPSASLLLEFPEELNGFRYRVEKRGQIFAITNTGDRVRYQSWPEFWTAAQGQRR
jgi:hypothetical protein